MIRTTTRGFRVAFFHAMTAEQDAGADTEAEAPSRPRQARYPKRVSHFAHKFVRRLAKSAAAQEIGPEVCWLLTVIAHQEDAVHYRRAVTFYDGQLLPLVGMNCRRTLARARDKAVEAGWLHYEAGRKGKPGTYWVIIPDHAEVFDDSPLEDDYNVLCDTSAPQTRRKRAESVTQTAPQVSPQERRKCHTSNPNPIPDPNPSGGEARAESADPAFDPNPPHDPADDVETVSHPHFDWLTIEQQFLATWNASPDTCKYPTMRNHSPKFRLLWMDPQWQLDCFTALAKLSTGFFAGKKLGLSQFLKPEFVTEVLGGRFDNHDGKRGTTAARHAGGSREIPLHLRLGGRDLKPAEGDPF